MRALPSHRPSGRGPSRWLAACTFLFGIQAVGLAASEELPFAPLFNGVDLAGWVNVNNAPDTFTVKDGMIVCSGHPTGVMRTAKMYENFVFEMEYRHMQAGGNAGLFVFSDGITARGQPFTRSIEVQVMDGIETANYTSHGDVFSIHGARMKPDRPHPAGWERCLPSEKRAKPSPEWNHYRVSCQDGRLELAVNGKVVSGASEIVPRRGFICLEAEGSEVHFRNLRIAELPPATPPLSDDSIANPYLGFQPLLNGRDLTGFRDAAAQAAHWKMQDWVLDYDGQGGDLWTEREFEDFELIVDWRFPAKPHEADVPDLERSGEQAKNAAGEPKTVRIQEAGDSGIFLRGTPKAQVNIWCWPIGSGEVWGYRTDPAANAQLKAACTPKLTADAPLGQWNRFVITLRGKKLSVVLNGKQVIDGVELDGIPARGPIALQHHGTPIQFGNLYIRELFPEVPRHRATTPGPHYEERRDAIAARAKQSDAKVALIGDSITQGWEGAGSKVWAERFANWSPIDLGVSGDETQHVVHRFQLGHYDGIHPDVAVVMIGTNNLGNSKHTPRETADGVRAILNEILTRWRGVRVLLLGVFPRGPAATDPFRAQIAELNGYLAQYADGQRIVYSDIGSAFLEKDGSLSPAIMPDFLHLSERGYEIWAEQIVPSVEKLLPKR